MTTSISSEALLNYKKGTWIIKVEKKEKPKKTKNSRIEKYDKPLNAYFESFTFISFVS